MEDWEQVVMSYGNVLELYPDYQNAYLTTNSVLHEKLFRFADSFALNRQWLTTHPNDEAATMNFAEAHLTTGRFAEAEQRFAKFLTRSELEAQSTIPLGVLHVVSLIGQRKWDSVSGQLKDIEVALGTQPEDFTLSWNFEGTTHFISQDEAFATAREWLLALLAAFSGTTRDAMVAAVETAQAQFVATDSASRTSGHQ